MTQRTIKVKSNKLWETMGKRNGLAQGLGHGNIGRVEGDDQKGEHHKFLAKTIVQFGISSRSLQPRHVSMNSQIAEWETFISSHHTSAPEPLLIKAAVAMSYLAVPPRYSAFFF